jgi:hypothetical protein
LLTGSVLFEAEQSNRSRLAAHRGFADLKQAIVIDL